LAISTSFVLLSCILTTCSLAPYFYFLVELDLQPFSWDNRGDALFLCDDFLGTSPIIG
jgi:hypothetical protein